MLKIIKIQTKKYNNPIIKKVCCIEGTAGYIRCVEPEDPKQLTKIVVIERKDIINNLIKLKDLRKKGNKYNFLLNFQLIALLMHYNANPLDMIIDLETYPELTEICGYDSRFLVDLLEKQHVNQVKFWEEHNIQQNMYNINII